nr:hypothetical protein [Tanacetum cinerariifolium]
MGILRQFSVARVPQQNGVAERRNGTLSKAARTMLADSKLPTTFWAEAVNTTCYITQADEGFFVGYSLNSKAFRVFNSKTRIVEEKLHIMFSKSTPNVVGSKPDWLFDINALTRTVNYEPIAAGTQSNTADPPFSQDPKNSHDDGSKSLSNDGKKVNEDPRKENEYNKLPFDPNMPTLEYVSIFNFSSDDEDDGTVADINNLDTTIQVSHIPTTRIHKDHPLDQVIRDLQSATQIRKMSKNLEEHKFVSTIQQRTNYKDL